MCEEETEGSIEHLLVLCPALVRCRQNAFNMLHEKDFSDSSRKIIHEIYNTSVNDFVQLLLDCSVIPQVISACQSDGNHLLSELFKFTRTWCYNVHSNRLKILGQWRNKY